MTRVNRLCSFALVGGICAGIYVSLYLMLSYGGLVPEAANALAFGCAVLAQYVGQTRLTFRQKLNDTRQMIRFGLMITGGAVTSSLITGVAAPYFTFPPWIAAVIVTLALPVQNFLFMSLWVFSKPNATRHV
ncbi:GtrA family protein [Sulfitobacter sp. 915]|uniref:GtrA family protein n=1 Tax=Sulfitobacter sp. 915 TaxID=3368558 RepID=UPI003746DC0E